MKTIACIFVCVAVAGCVVTGGVEYTDPKTGATASLGINKEFKDYKPKLRADGKRVVPTEP